MLFGRRARSSRSRARPSLARAGFGGTPLEAAARCSTRSSRSPSGVVFAVDEWADVLGADRHDDRKIHLALPDLLDELDALACAPRRRARRRRSRSCCRRASAGRSPPTPSFATRRGARRTPAARCASAPTTRPRSAWRRRPRAARPRARSRRGRRRGLGRDAARPRRAAQRPRARLPGRRRRSDRRGAERADRAEDRDPFVGTPWHKHVRARIERAAPLAPPGR